MKIERKEVEMHCEEIQEFLVYVGGRKCLNPSHCQPLLIGGVELAS